MKLKCIVIDDEPLAVQLMESYVKKTPFLELAGSFCSAIQAYDAMQGVDLIFCDIEMPGLSGIEFSKMIPENARLIFTTAFSNYALEGFRVNALDYLLKPISYDDFLASSQKALQWFEAVSQPQSQSQPQVTGMFVKTEYRLQHIDFDNILFVEGMKDYVRIHLQEGEPLMSLMSMKTMEEQLPKENFFRVHRSYIVNTDKITVIERNRIIFGKYSIPIADTAKDSLAGFLSRHSVIIR